MELVGLYTHLQARHIGNAGNGMLAVRHIAGSQDTIGEIFQIGICGKLLIHHVTRRTIQQCAHLIKILH